MGNRSFDTTSPYPGREDTKSPAQREASNYLYIYGELINPDSLAPIQVTLSPYGEHSSIDRLERELPTTHGRFFDGVLDPRVKKFQAKIPFDSDFAYVNIKIDGRSILENFIVLPSDSVKIGIDLSKFQLVFGGPSQQWFETQYRIKRSIKSYQFDTPRTLIELDREALLDQGGNRALVQSQDSVFGARIQILEQGKDATDLNLAKLCVDLGPEIPGFEILENSKSRLNSMQFQLLQSQLAGDFFGGTLSQLRRYDLIVSRLRNNQEALDKLDKNLPEALEHLKTIFNSLGSSAPTEGMIRFLSEWAQTNASFTNQPFIEAVLEDIPPKFQEQVLADYALAQVSKQNNHLEFLDSFLAHVKHEPWSGALKDIRKRVKVGLPLREVSLKDLKNNVWTWDMLHGNPTLVYFYFSTCTHSARYFRELLWPLYQEITKSTGLQLIAVSVDDNQELWKNAINEYSHPSLVNLNLSASENSQWLDYYLVDSYPRAFLLDSEGKILSLRIRENSLDKLKERVNSLLSSPNTSTINP